LVDHTMQMPSTTKRQSSGDGGGAGEVNSGPTVSTAATCGGWSVPDDDDDDERKRAVLAPCGWWKRAIPSRAVGMKPAAGHSRLTRRRKERRSNIASKEGPPFSKI
jgi:hypothetical protein